MQTNIFRIRLPIVFGLFAIASAFASVAAAGDLVEEIKHLSKDHPRDERMRAIEGLRKESEGKGVEKAIPGLSICATDEDPLIRSESIMALAMISKTHKMPCPAPLVNALLDSDKNVCAMATSVVGAFDEYPSESFAVAYKALESNDHNVRNSALAVIQTAGLNDKKALAAVKKSLNDSNLMVRGNAEVALWRLTGDKELKVRNLVERFVAPDPGVADPTISKEEICAFNMCKLGSPDCLLAMCRVHPRDVATSLIKLTKDASARTRSGGAFMLGYCYSEKPDETEADKATRRRTADMGIEATLQKLLADPDAKVQASAKNALEQLKKKSKRKCRRGG